MTNAPTVALIGAGGIAGPHLQGWLRLGATVRLHSLEGAAELVSHTGDGAVQAVGSLAQALDGAEIADVCTPTDNHAEIATTALAAGLDVLCEKPLARTCAQAQALHKQAQTLGRKLLPGHVVRWFPQYAALHAAIADGALGTLAVQRFVRTGSTPTREWFHEPARSGGIVLDQMIHDIDQAIWNAGAVVEVSGQSVEGRADRIATAHVLLRHSGGALSHITGTWGPSGTTFRTGVEVAGDRGLLQHDSADHPEVAVDRAQEGGTLLPPTSGVSPYHLMVQDFLAWVRGGPQPRLTAADGVTAIRVAEAAIAAIASGQPVQLEEVTA